jgi:hypothetical protein
VGQAQAEREAEGLTTSFWGKGLGMKAGFTLAEYTIIPRVV